jgi:hypothetical protein
MWIGWKIRVCFAALTGTMVAAACLTSSAVEVLLNGGLENGAGAPYLWSLTQSITGHPELPIGATEHLDSANQEFPSPGLGLLMYPPAGNTDPYENQNYAINVALSQTFTGAVAGRTYTFSGNSFFQAASSNNVSTLFADSPSGAVASPTVTKYMIEFLSSTNAVLGSQFVNLPKDRPEAAGAEIWYLNSVAAVAPANTNKVRVTAEATNMVASCTTACPAGNDVRFDNFSLKDSVLTTFERLQNPDLNTPGAPADWTLEVNGNDNVQFSTASYAKHSGNVGMWLRSFQGGDAKILQTVAGAPGAQYTFSGWTKWETGFSGGDPGANTEVFLRMEFLDSSSALIGSALTADLKRGLDGNFFVVDAGQQVNDNTWRQFSIATPVGGAPAGTAFVRVSAGATGMANTGINPQSAMFDDFSLTAVVAGVPGDYNNNDIVDAGDYVLWRKGGPLQNEVDTPGTVNAADYTAWRARFGNTSGSGNLLEGAAIPEPACLCIALVGLAAGTALRRRPM